MFGCLSGSSGEVLWRTFILESVFAGYVHMEREQVDCHNFASAQVRDLV
jgi:hypothetical protein